MSLQDSGLATDDEVFVDELKPGTVLMHGQYTIEGFLAAGGFGITYLARDSLDRRVVIKECFPGSLCRRQNASVAPRSRAHQNELQSIVRLFSQEAMSLAKANHPNIVGVHQVFEENNTAYMALDFVQGRDLLEILEDDPDSLKPELVEGYLMKVLDAIKHIHELGILHRDISPDNIIINEQNEPILIDFGAARESDNKKATRMLSALRVVKDGYSPQEFYIAGSDQTPSCDLYSLAASFYHLITKELPPDSQWRLSACAAGDEDPYVSLGDKTDDYSKNFVTAMDKAIAILPRDRMQNAEDWIAHVTNSTTVVSEIISSRADFVAAKGKKSVVPILLGSTALAAAAGIGILMVTSDPIVTPEADARGDVVASVTPAPVIEPVVDETPAPEETVAVPPVEPVAPIVPVAPVAPVEVVEAPVEPAVEPVAPVLDVPPLEIASVRPVRNPANLRIGAVTPNTAPVVPELPEITDLTTVVAGLNQPDATAGDVNFNVPSFKLGAPKRSNGLQALEGPALALQDANPVIDTVAPVDLIEPAPTLETAQGGPAVAEEDVATGVEFFVAMAAKQPDLVSAPSVQSQRETSVTRRVPVVTSPPLDSSLVQSRLLPSVPFSLSLLEPGLIVAVTVGAPEWLTDNTRIVSINGEPVTSNEQIIETLESSAAREDAERFDVALGLDVGLTGAVSDRTLTLETEQHTQLQNGLSFVSRRDGFAWKTQVTSVPSTSNFQVGDTIVSYILTWENLDGPSSLKTILDREMAKGTSNFSFAVNRGTEVWIEAFDLAAN